MKPYINKEDEEGCLICFEEGCSRKVVGGTRYTEEDEMKGLFYGYCDQHLTENKLKADTLQQVENK